MKQFLLSWTPPQNSSVSDYIIEYNRHNEDWQIYSDAINSNTSSLVTGLNSCSFYSFRVAAVNDLGSGEYSNIVSGMILASPPSAPQSLVAVTGDRKFDIYWEPPADNGGCDVSEYLIEYYKNDENSNYLNTQGIDNKHVLFNLTNNSSYSIRVAAINIAGTGSYSDTLTGLVPINKPKPISVFYIYPETNQYIGITWEEPKTDLTQYALEYSTNETDWTTIDILPSGTTYLRMSGLPATSYFFRISSFNRSLQSIHNQQFFTYDYPYDDLYNKTRMILRMGDMV